MSDEFNIYNNLNMIRGTNFSAHLKEMVAANSLNDCQIIDDSFDDFDAMLSNPPLESPSTRTRKTDTSKDHEKKSNKNVSSSPRKEGSKSPSVQLPGNMTEVLCDGPISARTRRKTTNADLSACNSDIEIISYEEATQTTTPTRRGRGAQRRNRGRGRGRTSKTKGTVALDSDGEEVHPQTGSKRKNKNAASSHQAALLDISLDDDNPELSVKINWNGKPESFKVRKHQKFATIFKLLAEREGTDIEKMVFNLNERIISPNDTPNSIEYKIFHFIDGRVMTTNENSHMSPGNASKKQRNPNQISLKIQSDSWKRPILIDIMKADKFSVLYIKCAEELNTTIHHIHLSFDGEYLDLNDTPADLDFEGGEAIDFRLKK